MIPPTSPVPAGHGVRRPAALVLLTLLAASWSAPASEPGARPAVKALADLPAGLAVLRTRMRAGSRPATPDLLAAVWRCPRCRAENTSRRLLPEQPPLDQLRDVPALMERVGLGRGGSWDPPPPGRCRNCGFAPDAKFKMRPSEVIFFRYLPESGCDAVARARPAGGRLGHPVWGRLDVTGDYDSIGPLADAAGFVRAFGRVISVREAWSRTVRKCIREREPRVLRVAPGYVLTCRPKAAGAEADARLEATLKIALAKLWSGRLETARELPLTAVTGSRLEKVIPTYRRWLAGQSAQLESGKYLAVAYLDPEVFWQMASREMPRIGVKLHRPATAREPELRAGAYRASLEAEAVLLKTMHAGLTYGEGLHQFLWPLTIQLSKMREVGEQARDALRAYETTVADGKTLVIRERPAKGGAAGSGKLVASLNVHALAGSVDPRVPGAVARTLRGVLGLDPASGKILPPRLDERGPSGEKLWLSRKLRPKGYFRGLGVKVLTEEWRGVLAAWSLEGPEYARMLPGEGAPGAKKLRERFERDLERSVFAVFGAKGFKVEEKLVRVAVGPDLASVLTHARLRCGLARFLKIPGKGAEVCFWAPNTNVVVITHDPVTGPARQDLRRAAEAVVRGAGLAPGHKIEIEIREKLGVRPAGKFVRR